MVYSLGKIILETIYIDILVLINKLCARGPLLWPFCFNEMNEY